MPTVHPLRVIDSIEFAVNELRPRFGLGPVTKDAEVLVLGVPLIAASDPVHPTLYGFFSQERVCLCVEWIVALHNLDELGTRLAHAMRHRRHRVQTASMLFGLAVILATNRPGRRSCAGWEFDNGNVFVQDSFCATEEELVCMKERVAGVIEHAREIRYSAFQWDRLECPDAPESPLENGFSSA